jgi:hypothetical protein
MGFIKKGKKKISIENTNRTAKYKLSCDHEALSELKGALKGLNRLEEPTEFVKNRICQKHKLETEMYTIFRVDLPAFRWPGNS